MRWSVHIYGHRHTGCCFAARTGVMRAGSPSSCSDPAASDTSSAALCQHADIARPRSRETYYADSRHARLRGRQGWCALPLRLQPRHMSSDGACLLYL